MNSVLVTGGAGPAGKSIKKHLGDYTLTPGKNELDLTSIESIKKYVTHTNTDYIDTVILNAKPYGVDFLEQRFKIDYMESTSNQKSWRDLFFAYYYGNTFLLRLLNRKNKIKKIFFLTTYKEIRNPMYRLVKSSSQDLLLLLSTMKEFAGVTVNFIRPMHMDENIGYDSLGIAFKNYLNDSERQSLYNNLNMLMVMNYGDNNYNFEAIYE